MKINKYVTFENRQIFLSNKNWKRWNDNRMRSVRHLSSMRLLKPIDSDDVDNTIKIKLI